MKAYTLEIKDLYDEVKKDIEYLEEVKKEFYSDGNGGQLYNTLTQLKNKNYEIKNPFLRTVMQYPDADSIDKEINSLKGVLPTLEKRSQD